MSDPTETKRDPGDAVPAGIAPVEPLPPTEESEAAKRKLEKLSGTGETPDGIGAKGGGI